ncbi:MAG TPA: alpha/beta hydrolase [Dehalococcoidia bacterium]|nr:alpha/beta hydrolase [Dehalococcoidia bacterium]
MQLRSVVFGLVLCGLPLIVAGCGGSSGPPRSGASPSAAAGTATPPERDVSFRAGNDTIFGTLELPRDASGRVPAALILAGSGPTDRNGNSKLIAGRIDTLSNFASVLAAAGVASLRYDKLGTGKTGLASFATHPADIGFDTYVGEALAAYDYLRSLPEVDPSRVLILGHSEGALIALIVAGQRSGGAAPGALVLAAPPGIGYLETIANQLGAQLDAAVSAGRITRAEEGATIARLDGIVASLRATGAYPAGQPITDPVLAQIFTAANEKFLGQVERYDPAQLAATLPASLPVLILHGAKDQQISESDIAALQAGFARANNEHVRVVELPNVDHVFKEVPGTPNPATDYANPALPFSSGAAAALTAFVRGVFP